MNSEKWDAWWAERGLEGLTDFLMGEWAPIWAGSGRPSRSAMRELAAKIGDRWRHPGRPVADAPARRPLWLLDGWLWFWEPDVDQREPTPQHHTELVKLRFKIERWYFAEFIGPSRAFLPGALVQSFGWLVDDYGFERSPPSVGTLGGIKYPAGWDGHLGYSFTSDSYQVKVSVTLPGHGDGHVSIWLGPPDLAWPSLPKLEAYARRYGLPVPERVMRKGWFIGFDAMVIEDMNRSSRLLRQVLETLGSCSAAPSHRPAL